MEGEGENNERGERIIFREPSHEDMEVVRLREKEKKLEDRKRDCMFRVLLELSHEDNEVGGREMEGYKERAERKRDSRFRVLMGLS